MIKSIGNIEVEKGVSEEGMSAVNATFETSAGMATLTFAYKTEAARDAVFEDIINDDPDAVNAITASVEAVREQMGE